MVGAADDYDALLDLVGDRRFVLIGEASHGTHEFYRERARITRRLIDELRVHRGRGRGRLARRVPRQPLRDGPVGRRRRRRRARPTSAASRRGCGATATSCSSSSGCGPGTTRTRIRRPRPGSTVSTSTACALRSRRSSRYLDRVDPAEARRARERYAASTTSAAKGRPTATPSRSEGALPCENEVVAQLVELRRRADAYLRRDGWVAEDELFFAEQNARVVRDAEEYYQQMYRAEVSSWNLRDRHMADTLDALVEHLDRQLGRAKVVVWEHNSHVGDARATAMGARGELNVGQLARQRYGDECRARRLHHVRRSRSPRRPNWGEPAERKHVRPALAGSYEALLHEVAAPSVLARRPRDPRVRERAARARGSSGRSASSTDPRPSGRATTSTRASPTSSTP